MEIIPIMHFAILYNGQVSQKGYIPSSLDLIEPERLEI